MTEASVNVSWVGGSWGLMEPQNQGMAELLEV